MGRVYKRDEKGLLKGGGGLLKGGEERVYGRDGKGLLKGGEGFTKGRGRVY